MIGVSHGSSRALFVDCQSAQEYASYLKAEAPALFHSLFSSELGARFHADYAKSARRTIREQSASLVSTLAERLVFRAQVRLRKQILGKESVITSLYEFLTGYVDEKGRIDQGAFEEDEAWLANEVSKVPGFAKRLSRCVVRFPRFVSDRGSYRELGGRNIWVNESNRGHFDPPKEESTKLNKLFARVSDFEELRFGLRKDFERCVRLVSDELDGQRADQKKVFDREFQEGVEKRVRRTRDLLSAEEALIDTRIKDEEKSLEDQNCLFRIESERLAKALADSLEAKRTEIDCQTEKLRTEVLKLEQELEKAKEWRQADDASLLAILERVKQA
ncbi:MAG: hypothetical protein AAF558_00120 [Verrucomicrobiota bacterium]